MKRLFNKILAAAFWLALCLGPCRADNVTVLDTLFTGPNVYAPFVFYDAQQNIWKMYYGGWQSGRQGADYVYYRTSPNGVNWSTSYTTVLTPNIFQSLYNQSTGGNISVLHVNDPSVTKFINGYTGQYQYTMFLTVCVAPCDSDSKNQIWSIVSSDGVNWAYPIKLDLTLASGAALWAAQPSAIYDTSGPSGTVWHVYHENRSPDGHSNIYVSYINGNRQVIGNSQIVFSAPGKILSAVNVTQRGTNWDLIFNVFTTIGGDIYRSTSTSNTFWSGYTPVIINNNQPYCGTLTPASVSVSPSQYWLYSSLIGKHTPNGACDFTANETMIRLTVTAP